MEQGTEWHVRAKRCATPATARYDLFSVQTTGEAEAWGLHSPSPLPTLPDTRAFALAAGRFQTLLFVGLNPATD